MLRASFARSIRSHRSSSQRLAIQRDNPAARHAFILAKAICCSDHLPTLLKNRFFGD
jgi:hypothetical protein